MQKENDPICVTFSNAKGDKVTPENRDILRRRFMTKVYEVIKDIADGYDGNVYGLVLNVNGVVINGFIETRPSSAIGNQDIYLQDIIIKNIISRPVEIIALCTF